MKRGFYTIMAAQFFSSLADNALLIAAIAQLLELDGPAWMVPLLKFFFTVSYVALAAFVGAFADAIPKGRDRKSTRLNSSHSQISYAVFCLKKKKKHSTTHTPHCDTTSHVIIAKRTLDGHR